MFKKILFMIMFGVILLPFGVDAAISNEEIAKRLFGDYDIHEKKYTVWSMYSSSGLGKDFYLAFKLPDDIDAEKLAQIEIKAGNFTINKEGDVTDEGDVEKLIESFANLEVDKVKNGKNIIDCGENDGVTYKNCNYNDYCNYWCSIAKKDVRMVEENEAGNLGLNSNNYWVSYFIYDNSGDSWSDRWTDCINNPSKYAGNPSCTLNRILRGKLANVHGNILGSTEEQAITSIQSRAFKSYKSSTKDVVQVSYYHYNTIFKKYCERNPSAKRCNRTYRRGNEEIYVVDDDKNKLEAGDEFYTFEETNESGETENYILFRRISTRTSSSFKGLTQYDTSTFNTYGKGIIKKYFADKINGAPYKLKQESIGKSYAVPVKFEITLYYYVETAPKIIDYNDNPTKTCETDNPYTVVTDKFQKKDDRSVHFDLISINGDTVDVATDDYDDINPFCYKTCESTLSFNKLAPRYPQAEAYVEGDAYKAGMGFNWNFQLGYQEKCDIVVNNDKDFYNNVTDKNGNNKFDPTTKDEWLRKCKEAAGTISSGTIESVDIVDYQYGYYDNGSLRGQKKDLKLESTSTPRPTKSESTTTTIGDKTYITTVKKFNYGNKMSYTTDEYKCVLKGSGTPVSCSTTKPHVESETTYPIHPQMNNKRNVPLNLKIKAGGKTIIIPCSYNVVNELFGLETTSNDTKTKATGLDVIYRPISLDNPFPGVNNKGTKRGSNWSKTEVQNFITNNRGVTTNQVYSQTPLYRITLNARTIQTIRNYNNSNSYDDFKLNCNDDGFRCQTNTGTRENILTTILKDSNISSGTCITRNNRITYYTCAGKGDATGGETP